MAERALQVVAVGAGGVELLAVGTCSECRGCGGRCGLFESALTLPVSSFSHPPRAGERWHAVLPDRALLQQSLRGHGVPLAGLLLGAAGGRLGAAIAAFPPDIATALGALLGTLLALRISKRHPGAALRLLPDAPDS